MTGQMADSDAVDSLTLQLSNDKLFLYVSLAHDIEISTSLSSDLETKLKKFGLTNPAKINEAVLCFQTILNNDTRKDSYVLLEGNHPRPPKDGRVDWARNFFKKGFKIDLETGQIDYRQRAADKAVFEDDFLCEVFPPIDGEDGTDVFGNPIQVGKGKPVHFKAGTNIREEGNRYIAEKSGRIRFSKGVLAVDTLYTVSGSVNLAVGNINHPGALVIEKNVESQAIVEAHGDIEIAGYVEDANVIADGDLHVGGGIFGKSGNVIQVSGELHARFIGNAVVKSEGDIVVEKYIDNCQIFTRGKVVIPSGRIVGGEIVALGGITVGEAGSDACIATKLIAGEDYILRDKLQANQDEENTLNMEVKTIQDGLEKVKGKIELLGTKAKKAILALENQSKKIQERLIELRKDIDNLMDESKENALHEISVLKRIFPASSFSVRGCVKQVKEEVPGPVKLVIKDGDIEIVVRRR